jgi:hypothetical protein
MVLPESRMAEFFSGIGPPKRPSAQRMPIRFEFVALKITIDGRVVRNRVDISQAFLRRRTLLFSSLFKRWFA